MSDNRYARPGDLRTHSTSADPGLTTLRFRLVKLGPGGTVYGPSSDGITADVDNPGLYEVTVASPMVEGAYARGWDTGPNTPVWWDTTDLVVNALGAPTPNPGPGLPPWAPTPDHVAAVVPNYTRGGFDDDSDDEAPGAEQGTFTENTSPTLEHVDRLISLACWEIQGRVGIGDLPERCWSLGRTTAVWHTAIVISGGKIPADTDDARGEHSGHTGRYLASLAELKDIARQPSALRLS